MFGAEGDKSIAWVVGAVCILVEGVVPIRSCFVRATDRKGDNSRCSVVQFEELSDRVWIKRISMILAILFVVRIVGIHRPNKVSVRVGSTTKRLEQD